jgi:plasmid stabilization system protein ParE
VKIVNLPAADREFAKAVAHYHKERPGRAAAFVEEIDRATALLADNPHLGTAGEDGVRAFVIGTFPYTMYYVIRPDRIVVAAISHHRRRPGYWRKRLKALPGV